MPGRGGRCRLNRRGSDSGDRIHDCGRHCGHAKSRQACRVGGGAVISFMDGSTIYPRELVDISLELAAEKGIKVQLKNLAVGGNEAGTYQRTAYGSRVLALSAPVRYIHSHVRL